LQGKIISWKSKCIQLFSAETENNENKVKQKKGSQVPIQYVGNFQQQQKNQKVKWENSEKRRKND
jgi:hypothetical protein